MYISFGQAWEIREAVYWGSDNEEETHYEVGDLTVDFIKGDTCNYPNGPELILSTGYYDTSKSRWVSVYEIPVISD